MVVPDLLVALRAPPLGDRTSYRLWENRCRTWRWRCCRRATGRRTWGRSGAPTSIWGVREYWLFDHGGRRLSAPLVGCRRRGRRYRRIAANAAGRLPSAVLGLELHVRDGRVYFHDPATGEDLLTFAEEAERADAAERRADAEKRRADAAERELARVSTSRNRAQSVLQPGRQGEQRRVLSGMAQHIEACRRVARPMHGNGDRAGVHEVGYRRVAQG